MFHTYCQWIPQSSYDFDIRCLHKLNWSKGVKGEKKRWKWWHEWEVSTCWIRDWFEVGGSGPWQTWGGDRGRGAHVWAPELGMFEAHRSGFLWKLLSAKQDRGLQILDYFKLHLSDDWLTWCSDTMFPLVWYIMLVMHILRMPAGPCGVFSYPSVLTCL